MLIQCWLKNIRDPLDAESEDFRTLKSRVLRRLDSNMQLLDHNWTPAKEI